MRKIATVKASNANATRLMICDKGKEGVFVFGYQLEEDSSCSWDFHFADLDDAYELGNEYGIKLQDWKEIANPLKYCLDDWINPVRVVGISNKKPQWGKFEKLVDGHWIPMN